jgi:uncharacterized membrane protein YbjE (DUF340 family)
MSKFLKSLIMILIFLVGVALVVLPFVFDMFGTTTLADEVPWVVVGLGALVLVLVLLRLLLWLPSREKKAEKPAKPAEPAA